MMDHKFLLYGKDANSVQRVKIYYQEFHFSQGKVEYKINIKSWAFYMKGYKTKKKKKVFK